MPNRDFISFILVAPAFVLGIGCLRVADVPGGNAQSPKTRGTTVAVPKEPQAMSEPAKEESPTVEKTDAEWKQLLTPEQYHVTREKGTERAFTGKYWNCEQDGTYECVCCGQPLFTSDAKYESGCG